MNEHHSCVCATCDLYDKDGKHVVVNVADAAEWKLKGWSDKLPAPKEPAKSPDKSPPKSPDKLPRK